MIFSRHLFSFYCFYLKQLLQKLVAAQFNTTIEFARVCQTIENNSLYQNKRMVYVSGLNIDVSPQDGQLLSASMFVPWMAYVQDAGGSPVLLQQDELLQALNTQATDNLDQIDLEQAMATMSAATEIQPVLP